MSKQLTAIVIVLALTGSAFAASYSYVNTGYVAEGHTLVQQHTVFVRLLEETEPREPEPEIEAFGAVVGLVKECVDRESRGPFDNAVLWFNDQFLFGHKDHVEDEPVGEPDEDRMGENPERTHDEVEGEEGFVENDRDEDDRLWERWAGCWIPKGFIHAAQSSGNSGSSVRQVIEMDHDDGNGGAGSQCDYDSSFYVSDPNGHEWVIDRLDCTGITGPLYSGHLQVDPSSPHRQGFADRAEWAYTDGTVRAGAPYPHPGDDTWDDCKAVNQGTSSDPTFDKCSLEYSFLLAISLDEHEGGRDLSHCSGSRGSDGNWAHEGESHPHNPEDEEHDCGPEHQHEAHNFAIVFHERAPHFVEENPYWDNAHNPTTTYGTPPSVTFNDDCEPQTIDADEPYQADAINQRSFVHPCDDESDRGFHAHDGSQTPRPT